MLEYQVPVLICSRCCYMLRMQETGFSCKFNYSVEKAHLFSLSDQFPFSEPLFKPVDCACCDTGIYYYASPALMSVTKDVYNSWKKGGAKYINTQPPSLFHFLHKLWDFI